MVTRAEWYARVNAAWPKPTPALVPKMAVLAAKRLWKWGMGARLTSPVRVTSGNRYSWMRHGELVVNPDRGWNGLIHDLSHLLWSRANNGVRPHEKDHAKLELRMVKEVVKRGWLSEEPEMERPKASKQEIQTNRFDRIKRRIETWEAKERRAKNAIKRLRKQATYYERQLAE